MTERYTLADHEEYRRQQDEKARNADIERRENAGKALAYNAWIRDGGTPQDFEREWPKLRGELRRKRIVVDDERAREAQLRAGTSRI